MIEDKIMSGKNKRRIITRIVCLALAALMVAGTLYSVIYMIIAG